MKSKHPGYRVSSRYRPSYQTLIHVHPPLTYTLTSLALTNSLTLHIAVNRLRSNFSYSISSRTTLSSATLVVLPHVTRKLAYLTQRASDWLTRICRRKANADISRQHMRNGRAYLCRLSRRSIRKLINPNTTNSRRRIATPVKDNNDILFRLQTVVRALVLWGRGMDGDLGGLGAAPPPNVEVGTAHASVPQYFEK